MTITRHEFLVSYAHATGFGNAPLTITVLGDVAAEAPIRPTLETIRAFEEQIMQRHPAVRNIAVLNVIPLQPEPADTTRSKQEE